MLERIWKDAVWSKVISVAIIALAAYIYSLTIPHLPILNSNSIPNWLTIIAITAAISITYFLCKKYGPKKEKIDSKEWFSEINDKLSNCGYARIYLRQFNHPDDFRGEHRDALFEILNTIKQKIESNQEIQILSYKPGNEKSGDDWLESQLGSREKIERHIKIRKSQPMTNSSSMYLFDDRFVIFNKVNNKISTYHIEQHTNSILFELIKRGFEQVWSES